MRFMAQHYVIVVRWELLKMLRQIRVESSVHVMIRLHAGLTTAKRNGRLHKMPAHMVWCNKQKMQLTLHVQWLLNNLVSGWLLELACISVAILAIRQHKRQAFFDILSFKVFESNVNKQTVK